MSDNIHDAEQLITALLLAEDTMCIYSVMKNIRNEVFSLAISPYYALYADSVQKLFGEIYVSNEIAKDIQNMRLFIKTFSQSFEKMTKIIATVDANQDFLFRSKLKFRSMETWNIHKNLGVYLSPDRFVIYNTQLCALLFNLHDLNFERMHQHIFNIGYEVGELTNSVRAALTASLDLTEIQLRNEFIDASLYYDINTNISNSLFSKGLPKELNLFFLHILCNLNFVRHELMPLFESTVSWSFRVMYCAAYYSHLALIKLKNYCLFPKNNYHYIDSTKLIEVISKAEGLFSPKLRNCMMHYDLKDSGVISMEYIDRPFYGIIETCFNGMSFHAYCSWLESYIDILINYLNSFLGTNRISPQLLED